MCQSRQHAGGRAWIRDGPGRSGSGCSASGLMGHQVARLLLNSVSRIFSIRFSSFFPLQVYTVLPACTDLGTEPGTGSSGARGSAWQPWDAGTGDAEGDPSLPPRSSSVVSRPRLAAAPQPPWCVHTWPTPVLVPSQRPCLPNKPPHLDGERFKTSKI